MSSPKAAPLTERRASDDQLRALLDAAVDAIILIDERGEVSRFNRAAEGMFGYAADEVVGCNVSMLMPEPYHSEHDGYIRRYRETGEARIIGIGREVTARRKDGTTFPIELSVGEFRHQGAQRGFVGILRDLSERREREQAETEARREADALRANLAHTARLGTLGEMVSGIAHEVNQPLTAIANYASACKRLLLGGQGTPGELVTALDKISDQAQRAGQVIRGLRSMTRNREPAQELLDCNELVRRVTTLVEFEFRNRGWRLELALASSLPWVRGDGVQIQQVLLNLISNGMDAMLVSRTADVIEVSTASRDRQQVEIRVRDSGPGVDPEVLPYLFDPFRTSRSYGMGLGLSICRSIVTAHGGTVTHEPSGPGATFVVRLPVAED